MAHNTTVPIFRFMQMCHFLVIEDAQDEAFLIERAFRSVEGCSYAICRNLTEAKDYLRGAGVYANRDVHPIPQIILSDFNIGTESGLHLLKWSHDSDALETVPILIFTNSAGPAEIQEALDSGARDVIVKPFDQQSLIVMLRGLAEKYCRGIPSEPARPR